MIFGGERPNPKLADQKLEALRRVAVLAWHKGYALPRHEIRAFHEAGFTPDQYETLLASISRGRAALNQGKRFMNMITRIETETPTSRPVSAACPCGRSGASSPCRWCSSPPA
jgi:hypothetical protein